MTRPLVDDLQMLELKGIVAYDALLGEDVLVLAPVIMYNRRQSKTI